MLQQPQPALPRACQPAGKESLTASAGYWTCCSERPRPGADHGGAQGGLRAWPLEAGVICAWCRGPGGRGHYSPSTNSCCCVRPDLTCKPLLLFPLSLSFPSTRFFLLPLSYVLLFPFQLILYLSFLLILRFSLYFSLPICFPFSPPARPGITTRLSRDPWTCQSSGGSCKRRTQLTTPPRRRWYQTSASCSGTVLSSIMYVFPVFPLPYFQ